MPRITDTGIAADDAAPLAAPGAALAGEGPFAVLLPNDYDPAALVPAFGRIALMAVAFPAFSDGRGFSLAQRLRGLGYTGWLRARGHLLPDQYAYARACGFDEIEIDDALLARQGTEPWRRAAARVAPPFRRRLEAGA
jgi:uncharacterized protein (DUF934 family)